jgi:hypothetical protein
LPSPPPAIPNDPAPRAAAADVLAHLGRRDEADAMRREADAIAVHNAAFT